jgi:DNA-binding IclR family transcriptional regulator
LRLTEISDELDLAKSTVHRHVKTLESLDYLEHEDQLYKVGFRMFKYASKARENFPVFDIVRDEADRLADITSERVNVYFERNGQLFEVYQAGRATHGGIVNCQSKPLQSTAPGRAILAQYDRGDPEVGERFDETVFEDSGLRDQLQEIRADRIAIERDDTEAVTRVASPVCESGKPVAVLCVSGPIDRITGRRLREDIEELLRSSTKTIEWELLSS